MPGTQALFLNTAGVLQFNLRRERVPGTGTAQTRSDIVGTALLQNANEALRGSWAISPVSSYTLHFIDDALF